MSSQENSQNNAYINQTWNNNNNKVDETVPRPPNPATESRLLGRLSLSRNERSHREEHTTTTTGVRNLPTSENEASQRIFSLAQQQPASILQHSLLNADAKVFVPHSETAVVSNSYYEQSYPTNDEYNLSVEVPEYLPHYLEGYNNYTDPYYPDGPYEEYEQDPNYLLDNFNTLTMNDQFEPSNEQNVPSLSSRQSIIERFNHALYILNMHPGNIEEYLRPICEMISNSSDTTGSVDDVVESLYNQGIQEANFRYTGARICQFLNTQLATIPNFSGFHKIFMKRCQQEYNRRDELKNGSQEDQNRLRGLTMFMAEIFLNVETELPDGTVQRIHFLPSILVNCVKTLLSAPSDLNVKCSCQLLKLSGGLIEDVVKNSPQQFVAFEEIFVQLQSLASSLQLTENTKFIIDTVMKLKKNDWNRAPSSPSKNYVALPPSEPNNFQAPDPVFYNKMGTPCSRTEAELPEEDFEDGAYVLSVEEETAFLIWQAEQDGLIEGEGELVINDSGYESFRPDTYQDLDYGGMGEEMEAAYEEFLHKQSYLPGFQAQHVTSSSELQTPISVPQTFNLPPPNMTQPQEFNGYQPQHILPPSQQQNQVPQYYQGNSQNHQGSQQQYQMPPFNQDQQQQYTNNNRHHYHQ